MDIIVSVASPFVQRQFSYILSYQENLQRLETKVQRLEDTKASLEHSVVEAERNGEKIEDIVQNWLKKANATVVETKRLIDIEGHAEVGCCLGQFPNLWTRSQLSKKFEEMIRQISEVLANRNFDRISYRVPSEVTITPP
ncbi:hypothetical protein CR513_57396, partial [Mucuna pruriens]